MISQRDRLVRFGSVRFISWRTKIKIKIKLPPNQHEQGPGDPSKVRTCTRTPTLRGCVLSAQLSQPASHICKVCCLHPPSPAARANRLPASCVSTCVFPRVDVVHVASRYAYVCVSVDTSSAGVFLSAEMGSCATRERERNAFVSLLCDARLTSTVAVVPSVC
jgi:hypothetical protein